MFKRVKKLKSIFLVVGSFFLMTQIIGCTSDREETKVLSKFNDFFTMFLSDDLSFLFDKEGEVSITGEKIGSTLEEGDLGTWCVSSHLNFQESEEAINSSLGGSAVV